MSDADFVDALRNFRSREADPRLRPDPFHLRELAERLPSAFAGGHLGPDLVARMRLLEDAGCADPAILMHCRRPREHLRGCWVVDLRLGAS
jgi:hypothetical protein